MLSIADLHRALEVLDSTAAQPWLARIQARNFPDTSIAEMHLALTERLYDAVLYEGALAVMQRRQLSAPTKVPLS